MFVSVQNELPFLSLKSNKLDGSFFFYPRTIVHRSRFLYYFCLM
ncbi:hypothetical protein HMPREF0673_02787 [Leyella stercorea DSM 18206]|uniref:Uncharacterized protein n=1 Tax=Leyella stercorea DSM 18206 TaxID=1002367 RepID=G6B1L2_9BACT|nr:hypothetical protein HMPREF0673_02787 [Leyella stercorea DSM 18206]